MWRTLGALLGLAVIMALFAGIYYSDDTVLVTDRPPAFSVAPGEVQADFLEPSLPGGEIRVNITVTGGAVDLWVMDQEWVASTIGEAGGFNLSRPFSYHAQYSVLNVSGPYNFTVIADGETRLAMVFDHSDAYYDDTAPSADAGPVSIGVQTRYLEEEQKSLFLGYLAVIPSVVLVLLTLGRQVQRSRQRRKRRKA